MKKLILILCILAMPSVTYASIAYGTLNNFDCVNDTAVEAHGFEIELDDVHSTNITYTYDYNHYGVPKIAEDNTDPAHPKVFVRYVSAKNPDGTWAAFTAIPSGPIAPTQGHQFTNPAVNFGGEHFGVGFTVNPSAVKNSWLIDSGSGTLINGPPVNVSTPTFTYNPPAGGAPAFVVAVIVPPPPPVPPVNIQFGDASWVKAIKTTTHNPNKVQLDQLVGDDPGQPQPWANGEPAEVEMEWKLLQTQFANPANPKGVMQGANEGLPGGDEVVTRRYEFYKYVGPFDAETHEAMADVVGAADPDGVHYFGSGSVTYADHFDFGTGEWVTVTTDLSTVWVVADFFGAQMAGFDVAPALGLVDRLQDGELNVAYPNRTVVVPGVAPFLASLKSGALPDGLTFDDVAGVLSGTPTAAGAFTFTIQASDTTGASLSKSYTITIPGAVVGTSTIATSASPLAGGTTSGDGTYNNGTPLTVVASHNPGYAFVNWTEGGVAVSATAVYPFTVNADRTLVANFVLSGAATSTPTNTPTNTPTATSVPATPTLTATPTPSVTLAIHDSVVLPVAPINVTIPKPRSGAPLPKTVKVKVKVRNADPSTETQGDSILLTAESVDCPPGVIVGAPDFLPSTAGADNPILIPGATTKTATVPVTVDAADFETFNHKAPHRCTLRFTATTQIPVSNDPTPNNVVTAELNVIDNNDPESASPPHESVLKSLNPLRLTVKKQAASPVLAHAHPVVLNADILPKPDAGDVITVSVDPASCPWIVAGVPDMDKATHQPVVAVNGGKSAKGKLTLQLLLALVTTPNADSPARCMVVLHATGPGAPDPDPSNNQTTLTIDVIHVP